MLASLGRSGVGRFSDEQGQSGSEGIQPRLMPDEMLTYLEELEMWQSKPLENKVDLRVKSVAPESGPPAVEDGMRGSENAEN